MKSRSNPVRLSTVPPTTTPESALAAFLEVDAILAAIERRIEEKKVRRVQSDHEKQEAN